MPADYSRVLNILHNPAYAGTYAYGRRRQDPLRRRAGRFRCTTVKVVVEQWPVCLHDAHPGYISWEEFMANQARLAANLARHAAQRPGVAGHGWGLLQWFGVWGGCGRGMGVGLSGPHGDYPVYHCSADQSLRGEPRCQEVRALNVDAVFEQVLLEALAPDQIALAVAAVGQIAAESQALEHQWALKRERARYEAERARRQYDAVEPENRLVARSLERVWEEKLRQAEVIEQEYTAWRKEQMGAVADAECAEILGLAQDLPRVWQTATAEERKRILRLVVREVALDQKRERGLVRMRITWQTGATSAHRLRRRVQGYVQYADTAQLVQRVRDLNAAGMMDREIAVMLNAEGTITGHGTSFAGGNVHVCRKRWGIMTVKINGVEENPPRWPDGTYSVQGAAAALGVTPQTVFKWLRKGRLVGRQLTKGQPWQIKLPDEEIMPLAAQVRRINQSKKEAS